MQDLQWLVQAYKIMSVSSFILCLILLFIIYYLEYKLDEYKRKLKYILDGE